MTSKLSVDIVVSEMSAAYSTSSTSVTCMLVATYIFGSDYTEKAPEIRTLGLVFNFPRRTAGLRAPLGPNEIPHGCSTSNLLPTPLPHIVRVRP